jgi:hypothetical protein
MWCEEMLVANCSKLVRSNDTIRCRAAFSPEVTIGKIVRVKNIGMLLAMLLISALH